MRRCVNCRTERLREGNEVRRAVDAPNASPDLRLRAAHGQRDGVEQGKKKGRPGIATGAGNQ
ncbi:protein of unknown function [Pararobbsia alpina]